MKHHPLKKIAWVLATLLLAGCHKLEATTSIKPNGSGELQTGIGFSAEERANIDKQYANSQYFCNTSQTHENVSVTEEQRGDETWCVTTTQFKNLDELRALYEQQMGIPVNRLETSDGKFYYDVDVDTLSEGSTFSMLTDIKWSVVLPGEPISHNADEADGNTLIWKPTPKSGVLNFQAESEVSRGFNFPSCGTALIGFGVVFVHLRKKRFGAS
ncbi:MAG TPA: hypothetical protein PLR65_08485 [Anaerolineales bacterium]|nr:hypothetical protein [Anaerolineales bacterium]